MSIYRLVWGNRVVCGALVAAAAIGVPSSAMAIGSGPSAPKSTTAPAAAAASKSPGLSGLSALAASAGITESRLQSGLVAAKEAGGNTTQAVTQFARSTGVPLATAQRIVGSVFGPQPPSLTSPSVAAALAARLGVSRAAAQLALEQIAALSGVRGVDPNSAAFAAIAHHLGVSPTQLAPALKQSIRSAAGA
jgi:hypothetical protein